ncbi:uncharacterized protein LOC133796206 [Humulus lupulus]|uniref:uncharacterized protein LOC133796206 n=1 Tax=Humulus lupulus TaxID=3486 RepID=UPI002B40EE66|nr:uncharacterized protein LOC133796206 [Humulus lupulus]
MINKRGALLLPIEQYWVLRESLSIYPEALLQLTIAWHDVVQDNLDFDTIEYTIHDLMDNYDFDRLEVVLVKNEDGEMEKRYETQTPDSSILLQEEQEAHNEFVILSRGGLGTELHIFLNEEGQIVDNNEEVVAHFFNHFKGFLGKGSITTSRADQTCFQQGLVMNLEQQLDLIQPFSKKDVKRALFSISSIKSPSPDGFGSAADYRPIECCNRLYKCISKMLCFRLAKILPMLIHQNQGAFIKNRQLAHNILILQDLLHGYTRKNITPRCLIKIDLSKAYDSIDWVFLEDILSAFCFPSKFAQWIMICLTDTSYSLMLNGRLQGSFAGRKGLRQGDPISPLLFVLVMEYLTRLLNQVSQHRKFCFHPMSKNLHLVNLCFANDLILFCKGNFRSVQLLMEGFL